MWNWLKKRYENYLVRRMTKLFERRYGYWLGLPELQTLYPESSNERTEFLEEQSKFPSFPSFPFKTLPFGSGDATGDRERRWNKLRDEWEEIYGGEVIFDREGWDD